MYISDSNAIDESDSCSKAINLRSYAAIPQFTFRATCLWNQGNTSTAWLTFYERSSFDLFSEHCVILYSFNMTMNHWKFATVYGLSTRSIRISLTLPLIWTRGSSSGGGVVFSIKKQKRTLLFLLQAPLVNIIRRFTTSGQLSVRRTLILTIRSCNIVLRISKNAKIRRKY